MTTTVKSKKDTILAALKCWEHVEVTTENRQACAELARAWAEELERRAERYWNSLSATDRDLIERAQRGEKVMLDPYMQGHKREAERLHEEALTAWHGAQAVASYHERQTTLDAASAAAIEDAMDSEDPNPLVVAVLLLAALRPPVAVTQKRLFVRGARRWREATQREALRTLRAWVTEHEDAFMDATYSVVTLHAAGEDDGKLGLYLDIHEDLPLGDGYWHAETLRTAKDSDLLAALRACPALNRSLEDESEEANVFTSDKKWTLTTPNGVYDLSTGELSSDDDAWDACRMTKVAPAAVADPTTCPHFLDELEWALPDPAVRDWLQLALGMATAGAQVADLTLWLYGPHSSGKTTIIEGVEAALGEYTDLVDASAMLRGKPSFPSLTRLRGRRLAHFSELDKRYHFDRARLKRMTNTHQPGLPGDAPWESQFTLLFETNTPPAFGGEDDGGALERRLAVIPFDQQVEEGAIDPMLRAEVRAEAAGILRWLMDGAKRFHADRRAIITTFPEAMRVARQRFLFSDDPEVWFLRTLRPTEHPQPFADVYDQLAAACQQARQEEPSKKRVAAELRKRGIRLEERGAHKLYIWAELPAMDWA